MSDPEVGIIVRTKDRPRFLRRALHSIASQTLTDWQCVIVNDGGDPQTVEDVRDELDAGVRARVKIVHSPESRGRWTSANAGVLATRAPLLVLHDDDDTWHPRFLELSARYLAQHPERDGVVSRIEIIWEQVDEDEITPQRRELFQPQLHDLLLSDALLFNRYVPIGFVYRRRLHEELGLYDESLPVTGDWAFNLRVLQRGPLEFVSDTPLAYWHQRAQASGEHSNSVIGARDAHARFDALQRDEALRAWVADNGLGPLLYLTKFIDQRFVDVENGIRAEIVAASFFARLRRRLRPFRRKGA